MFNKPTAFGRNEPGARRDAVPGLASTARPAAAERTTPAANSSEANSSNNARSATYPPVPAATATAVRGEASELGKDDGPAGAARLIVGPAVKLKGAEILDCDTLIVEGRVEATMDSRRLRIAENGSFAGTVSIDVAEIHGCFEGELTARSQLVIHATGRVSGTIRFGKLVVAEGGELNGEISVIADTASTTIANTAPARSSVEPRITLGASAA